jgi:hypothetical protein
MIVLNGRAPSGKPKSHRALRVVEVDGHKGTRAPEIARSSGMTMNAGRGNTNSAMPIARTVALFPLIFAEFFIG